MQHLWIFERIRMIRAIKRIKTMDMANRLGISQSYYSKLENGQVKNYIAYLPKVCKALELDIDDLFKEPNREHKDAFLNYVLYSITKR